MSLGATLRHVVIFTALTVLTQIGGLAWLGALVFRRRLLALALCYGALWALAVVTAPVFGRVPLHCGGDGPLRMHSVIYCATARNYMSPELLNTLEDVAAEVARQHPGAVVQVLDANFPFLDGFPLLPHLSHDDGDKVDLALFYSAGGQSLGRRTPSPIGYFHFPEAPTGCPRGVWPTMRWDMGWLQPLWPEVQIDDARTAALMRVLTDHPSVGKIFLEPWLRDGMGLAHPKIRFQGCRAARHDDHIHMQL